jgi:hypothetical protein
MAELEVRRFAATEERQGKHVLAMEESDVGGRDFRQLWSFSAACPLLISLSGNNKRS